MRYLLPILLLASLCSQAQTILPSGTLPTDPTNGMAWQIGDTLYVKANNKIIRAKIIPDSCKHIWVQEYEDGLTSFNDFPIVCVKCYKKDREGYAPMQVDTTKLYLGSGSVEIERQFDGVKYWVRYDYDNSTYTLPSIVGALPHFIAQITISRREPVDGKIVKVGDTFSGTFVPPGGGCFEDNPLAYIQKAINLENAKKSSL